MIRVGVVGAAGRMGQEVCKAVAGSADMTLVAAVDPASAGARLDELGGPELPPLEIHADLEALRRAGAEVAVEFTVAAASRANLVRYGALGVHAVVGTSGLTDEDIAAAAPVLAQAGVNAVVAANFALGAVLLMRFSEMAAPLFAGMEIIELHHDAKRDAPSGTAMATAARMDAARRAAGAPALGPDPTQDAVLPGARGGEAQGGIRIHAVRLPGLVAHQEVLLGSAGEALTMRHDSFDRRSFMGGVLLAVRHVGTTPGVTRGIESLLGL